MSMNVNLGIEVYKAKRYPWLLCRVENFYEGTRKRGVRRDGNFEISEMVGTWRLSRHR
jgi:hypothetical protein